MLICRYWLLFKFNHTIYRIDSPLLTLFKDFNHGSSILRNLGITSIPYNALVSYYKNLLQFLYHLTLLEIKYFSRVLRSYPPFLYPYMVTLPAFLQLLPFKRKLHFQTFVLHLTFILTFHLPHNYGTMQLDRIFFCPT